MLISTNITYLLFTYTLFTKVGNHQYDKYNVIFVYSNANNNMNILIKVNLHHKKFKGNKMK